MNLLLTIVSLIVLIVFLYPSNYTFGFLRANDVKVLNLFSYIKFTNSKLYGIIIWWATFDR